MEIIAAETGAVSDIAKRWLDVHGLAAPPSLSAGRSIGKTPAGMPALPGIPFDDLPVAVQRRCLQLQLEVFGVAVEFDLVERLRSLPERAVSAGWRPERKAAFT